MGIGRQIKSLENKYIFLGMVELNGQYTAKTIDKTSLNSHIVPNTGGNIIYATPSLWYSTAHLIIQLGLSLPINQYGYGNQSNVHYIASGNITWTIT